MKIITRIYKYLDFQDVAVSNFERKTGISNGYLAKMRARNADVGEGILRKVLENCPEVSVEWLVTGRGEMLRAVGAVQGQELPPKPPQAAAPPDQSALVAALQQTIAAKDELIAELKKRCATLEDKPPNSTAAHPQTK